MQRSSGWPRGSGRRARPTAPGGQRPRPPCAACALSTPHEKANARPAAGQAPCAEHQPERNINPKVSPATITDPPPRGATVASLRWPEVDAVVATVALAMRCENAASLDRIGILARARRSSRPARRRRAIRQDQGLGTPILPLISQQHHGPGSGSSRGCRHSPPGGHSTAPTPAAVTRVGASTWFATLAHSHRHYRRPRRRPESRRHRVRAPAEAEKSHHTDMPIVPATAQTSKARIITHERVTASRPHPTPPSQSAYHRHSRHPDQLGRSRECSNRLLIRLSPAPAGDRRHRRRLPPAPASLSVLPLAAVRGLTIAHI